MENDRDMKLAMLNGLAGNFSATLSPETSKLWLYLLKDYPAYQVQNAVLSLIRKRSDVPYKSLPPFAMLQEELDRQDGTIQGDANIRLQAESEWNWLIERLNVYSEPEMNPATARVVRMMGGWQCVCGWPVKDLQWRHKDFVELWQIVHGKEDLIEMGANTVARFALPASKRMEGIEAGSAIIRERIEGGVQ